MNYYTDWLPYKVKYNYSALMLILYKLKVSKEPVPPNGQGFYRRVGSQLEIKVSRFRSS